MANTKKLLIPGGWVLLLYIGLLFPVCSSEDQQSSEELFKLHEKELEELKKLAEDGGHPSPDDITKFDADVCYTRDCIEAAREFHFATSYKEDPCEKGSWLKYVCVRRTMVGEGNEDDDLNQQAQVGYLGTVAMGQSIAMLETKDHPYDVMNQAALYYEQCEKWKETDNDTKIAEILEYLGQFGEWPLLAGKESPGEKFDWKLMMANTVRIAVAYGVAPYLFDIFLEEGHIPLLFTGELNLHKNNSEIVEIIKIMSKGNREISENDTQILEMVDFLKSLNYPSEAKITTNKVSNITEHHDFGENFDLLEFYSNMLSGTHVQITPDSEVAADVEWLVNHVKAVNGGEPRVIANILFLQTAGALLTRLTTMTHNQHLPTLQKYRSQGPLDCLQETYEKFDYAMSYEFIRKYFDHDGTATLVHLVEDLKDGYVDTLNHAPFLSSQTKVHAVDKANDIHTFIAAESWVMDDGKLKEYYKSMNVSKDMKFVGNHVAGLRFHWTKFLELTNPNIFNYLVGDAYTGYAASKYSYHFNQLRIQAALVQKPLFSAKYPGFMNYGGIGTVLAHSLGHSFDTNGVHFDKSGHRGDFWDDLSYEGYYNWTDGLIEDYNSEDYKQIDPWGSRIDGDIDHSEAIDDDIADIVGVHMAYRAYQKHLGELEKDGQKEMVLPGLKEFPPNKLFWMKYANMWCEHTDKSYLHALRHFNMHSPGNIRATLPISRNKQWANDFSCPAPAKSEF